MSLKEHVPQVYAANSNVGCVRGHNEDSFIAQSPLFVVADGMGGHEAGEVASEIAVTTISKLAPKKPDRNAFVRAIEEANRQILDASARGIGKPGMGTTVTAALIFDDQLIIAQVGDSRAYLLHDGRLQRITRDHSLVADLVDQGSITEEEARVHPQRSVITRALGSEYHVEPDIYSLRVANGDRLLLCSDGLSSMIFDSKIESVLNGYEDTNDCCDALINEAMKAGGLDNITVIVVDPLKDAHGNAIRRNSKGKFDGAASSTKARKKHRIFPVVWILAFVIILAGAGFGFYEYTQHSYYVIAEDGYVNIYKGLPGSAAGIKFSWLEENTDIKVSKLAASTAGRLEEGISVDSLEEAQSLVNSYRMDIAGDTDAAIDAGKGSTDSTNMQKSNKSASATSSSANASNATSTNNSKTTNATKTKSNKKKGSSSKSSKSSKSKSKSKSKSSKKAAN